VVAGESANDREVLRCFLEEFCPEMQGRIVFLNDKVPLRDAGEENLKKRVARFAAQVRAKAARERASIAAVFVHEDLDQVDSGRYEMIHKRVQRALVRELGNAHYVLAVWEIEAWLLLFPDEVAAFATKWQVPASRRGRDTGRFQDPKRIFKEEISRAGTSYRESDAPAIANRIIARGALSSQSGSNRSYEVFRSDAAERCLRLTDKNQG
jgi:hypothetical protein